MPLQADIDSNDVVLSIAEEVVGSIGVLPGTPVWYAREPNTVADTGGDPSLAARSPLGTRKRLAGSLVGIDAKAGWNEDFTQNNFVRLLQGFFCADVSGEVTTQPINGAAVVVTSVSSVDNSYNAASGLGIFLNNMLVYASGFTNAVNNGLKRVTTPAANKAIVSPAGLVTEASPPAAAKLEAVGLRAGSGDLGLTYSGGVFTLTSTTLNFTTLPLAVGGWFFLGGDDALNKFATANIQGYCRIASIAANAIVIDKSTFAPAADAGAGKKIDIYFGKYFRDPATNKVRTYQTERKLGSDGVGIQTEYTIGAFPNELTLTIPKKEKLNVDMSFVAIDYSQQTGTTGPKGGTRVAALGEGALNSGSDLYRISVAPAPTAGVINQTPYFGYATDGSVKLTNNGDVNEAIGSSVGFDINVGEFDATAQFNAYFNTIALMQAVRNHGIATFDAIIARSNAGWLIDFPNAELTGGIAKPEKNKAVMVPLTALGVLNPAGYVAHMQQFVFLPAAAMPVINQGFAVQVSNTI